MSETTDDKSKGFRRTIRAFIPPHLRNVFGRLLALLCVVLLFALVDKVFSGGTFFAFGNLRTVMVESCIVAIAALGMIVIIIAGGIDLSAGTAFALCATVLAWGLKEDVAFLCQNGDNFASASSKFDQVQNELLAAQRKGDTATIDSLKKNKRSKKIEELKKQVSLRRKRLIRIAKKKLVTVRRREAEVRSNVEARIQQYEATRPGKQKSRRRHILSEFQDRHKKYVESTAALSLKIDKLREIDFRTETFPGWNSNIPNAALSSVLAVALGIATGMLAGFLNGLLITSLRIVPFIATLGTMSIFLGTGNYISNNTPISPQRGFQVPDWIENVVSNSHNALWFGLFPTGIVLVLILAILLAVLLRYSVFGRYVIAIGSNESTARLCGINIRWVKISIYTLAGVFYGIAGMCLFAKGSTGDPESGRGQELLVIAAVVIGGGSLNGGRGSVIGAIAGAVLMYMIDSGCLHLNMENHLKYIILGTIIIGAVTIDQFRQRRLETG